MFKVTMFDSRCWPVLHKRRRCCKLVLQLDHTGAPECHPKTKDAALQVKTRSRSWPVHGVFSLHVLSRHALSPVEVVSFEGETVLFLTDALLFYSLPSDTACNFETCPPWRGPEILPLVHKYNNSIILLQPWHWSLQFFVIVQKFFWLPDIFIFLFFF